MNYTMRRIQLFLLFKWREAWPVLVFVGSVACVVAGIGWLVVVLPEGVKDVVYLTLLISSLCLAGGYALLLVLCFTWEWLADNWRKAGEQARREARCP